MAPITLIGRNLGERHRCLNAAVNEAYAKQEQFTDIVSIPEISPIDRIFKINLASKFRNVDYIVNNLKDDDMFYVSKALKSKWLLDTQYEQLINPQYLENQLYPSMITTAVTKMKHWVYINLKDSVRCQTFYLYYCDINFNLAMKFLRNCSAEFIQQQFSLQMHKISPHDFKVLCEKNSYIAQIFYHALLTDEELKIKYLSKEKQYFSILKSLLKVDGTMVLDITEKYFNEQMMKPFNPKATKFIMQHYRTRFIRKPELYTALLLNLKTLANCLNTEQAIDLLLILARDNYLISQNWFNYKKAEPLIKRVKHEDRGPIKKKVFVDKDVGNINQEWSYEMPAPPVPTEKVQPIFKDYEHDRTEYYSEMDFRKMLKKRKYAKWATTSCVNSSNIASMLDKLFNEYRVASYEKTLYELRKKLKAESSAQNRQYMMLVLVSKSGGHEKNLISLMELLSVYKNEPAQVRATVVRSLVKRACVWRIPAITWNQLLEFSHGLGLDGKPPEADCTEGVHAVIIRQILVDGTCDSEILSVYLNCFSTLVQYSISKEEKEVISNALPKMLFVKACEETDASTAENVFNKLLDTLNAFNISVKEYPSLISKIKSLASNNIDVFSGILKRLYNANIARRELFKVNFEIIQTEASYLNALRHDTEIISIKKLVKIISDSRTFYYERFFRKVSIYFNENCGLSSYFLDTIKKEKNLKVLAKPLTILLGNDLMSYIKNIDGTIVDVKDKSFAACIRANIHLSRPALDIDTVSWATLGTKAVANKILICPTSQIQSYVQKLFQNKQTTKLAYVIAKRNSNDLQSNCFTVLSKLKPTAALKLGLKHLVRDNTLANQEGIWDVTKSLLENLDIDAFSKKYVKLPDVSHMPVQIQPPYSIILHTIYKKKSIYETMPFLCDIENILPNVPEEFIEQVLIEYINEGLPDCPEKYDDDFDIDCNCLYIRLLFKYILCSKTEAIQAKRYELFGATFFHKIKTWFQSINQKKHCSKYVDEILSTFPYYNVYLNDKYVSCMPVMTKVLSWMKENLPLESNFKRFVHIHLNMLYYKAIKETIASLPNHCIDDNQMESRRMVGYIFGKYIAREINELKTSYFDSIQYLYKDIILELEEHFLRRCKVFTQSLIEGVLESEGNDSVLSVYLLKQKKHCLGAAARDDILLKLRKFESIEMQMVFFAETYT